MLHGIHRKQFLKHNIYKIALKTETKQDICVLSNSRFFIITVFYGPRAQSRVHKLLFSVLYSINPKS